MAAATSGGMFVARSSGYERESLLAMSLQDSASRPISVLLTGGLTHWLSSAPPLTIATAPVWGSMNWLVARPSQKRFGAYAAMIGGLAERPVICVLRPKTGSRT